MDVGQSETTLNGKKPVKSRLNRDGILSGSIAPIFVLPDLDGNTHKLEQWLGRKVLLIFSDPDCEPCELVLKQLSMANLRADVSIVVVTRGDPERNREKFDYVTDFSTVLLQRKWEVSRDYGIFATPVAYLIDETGVLLSNVMVGASEIVESAKAQIRPRDIIVDKAESLREEMQKGRSELASLDQRRAYLTETILRIEGGIAALAMVENLV